MQLPLAPHSHLSRAEGDDAAFFIGAGNTKGPPNITGSLPRGKGPVEPDGALQYTFAEVLSDPEGSSASFFLILLTSTA